MTYANNKPDPQDRIDWLSEKAIAAWGTHAQTNMAIEECAEFIVAVRHNDRRRSNDVIGKIADVIIMMHQMRTMFGTEEVDKRIAGKLDRLERKLADKGIVP